MADASRHVPPPGWRDAFAALPLESPPASRWPAIDAALDDTDGPASPARTPWPRRLAWAAAIAAIALPAALWLRVADDTSSPDASSRTPFATTAPPASSTSHATSEPPAAASVVASTVVEDPLAAAPQTAGVRERTPTSRPAIAQHATRATTVDVPAPAAKAWPRARVAMDDGDDASMQAAFEPYYTEAARLERVIAAARDPRVASGPAASLAGALDAELAAVDARLAQPGLGDGQRLALWRERVETLRASAEFESQLRLIAAEGGALDGALVDVH